MSQQLKWDEISTRLHETLRVLGTESAPQEEKRKELEALTDYLARIRQQPSTENAEQVTKLLNKLHDVAFSGLDKPGELTDEEWQAKLEKARTMLKNGTWTAVEAQQYLTRTD